VDCINVEGTLDIASVLKTDTFYEKKKKKVIKTADLSLLRSFTQHIGDKI
jgi:hypothetical protein